ncbi:MAG: YbjN domain-containing protein [Oscillospiraceae bacterium]|nr:YbjN domain-containing protein [Oscillospiraceae bacterium]
MVYQATQVIYDAMKEHNLECGMEARDEFSAVHIGINTESTSFEARFISRSDENDVALRIFNLLKFPPERTESMLLAVNECNFKYRFLRFVVDTKNNAVDACYDFTGHSGIFGETAYELLLRSASIIDNCYPVLMHEISG